MTKGTRTSGKLLLAALGCGAALVAGGCGGDKEGKQLPSSSVASLQTSLDSIQRRYELGDGACRDIIEGSDTDVAAVRSKLDNLPADTDKDVRDALEQSFQNLFQLVQDKCQQAQTDTTPTETTPTQTTTTPETVTETVPTETTPTQTTTTPEKQKPGKGDKGKGKGNGGNGNGNGGGSGGESAPGGGG